MPIDFHPLSMMDLRRRPGEVLDEVASHDRAFIIERNRQRIACLVPLSIFLPDIQPSRISKELERLAQDNERCRIAITETHEIQLRFSEAVDKETIVICITLPHGYPHKAPVVTGEPIDDTSPHRWKDGSLCIFGAMESWNPGRHDVVHTLNLCRRWLTNCCTWRKTGSWPKPGRS